MKSSGDCPKAHTASRKESVCFIWVRRTADPTLAGFPRLQGRPVRPHDLEIVPPSTAGAVPGKVERVVRLGFEVRVDVATDDGEVWVQLTRGDADRLAVTSGTAVGVRLALQGDAIPAPATAQA